MLRKLLPVLFFLICIPCFALAAQEKAQSPAAPSSAPANNEAQKNADEKISGENNEGEKEEEDKEENHLGRNAWEAIWTGQRDMLNEIRETALKLSDSFSAQTENLTRHLQPFEEEGRRLLVFANTFKGFPYPLEAVNRRITATIRNLDEVLQPVTMARSEAEGLLARVNYMAQSLPEDMDRSRFSQEMKDYVNDITRARLRLTAVIAQYDSLVPSLGLVKRLEDTHKRISEELPELWKTYYLQKPVAWLNPDAWLNIQQQLYYQWQAVILRLPVEMPATAPQWGTAILRFFIGLLFSGIFCLILRDRCLRGNIAIPGKRVFRVAAPLFCLGFALCGSAMSANGDFFRYFLALGSWSMILGEVFLTWDLRGLQYPDSFSGSAPFLKILPPAFVACALFYLPFTQPLILVGWLCTLIYFLLRRNSLRGINFGSMQLESGVLECYPIMLWICLFLAVSGIPLYSILLYLAYVALSLAMELSLAGIALIGRINEYLPKEGARAVLARLGVALAAPFALVVAVGGICLWIIILPGGTYILGEYALKGVTFGATQFNIIQALLIVSAFYITRTVVAMGTRFLAKLPRQGLVFDPTLITPMQTALTYAAWAIFGLFVLRSLGMELSNLAMVAGGLSVGIGFGMQTIVNNFLSGLILIFGRNLQVGDVVEVGGTTGRVRKISVRATLVETYDNAMIYVPNSEFMSGRLINWTSFSRSVRVEVQVGVAYGSDTAHAIALLISVAKANENVLKYPAPSVNFADFAASSLDLRLRFWVRDYDLGVPTASEIRMAINRAFAEEKIEIAFPQLDVHLKDTPPCRILNPRPRLSGEKPLSPDAPPARRLRPKIAPRKYGQTWKKRDRPRLPRENRAFSQ